jgi:hypothetical protein
VDERGRGCAVADPPECAGRGGADEEDAVAERVAQGHRRVGGAEPPECVGGLGPDLGRGVAQARDQLGGVGGVAGEPEQLDRGGADLRVLAADQAAQAGQRRVAELHERPAADGPLHAPGGERFDDRRDRDGGAEHGQAAGRGGTHVAVRVIEGVEQRRDRRGRRHIAERRGGRGPPPRSPRAEQPGLLVDVPARLEESRDVVARLAG